MPSKPIDLDELELDISNPRFGRVDAAGDAVRAMLDYQRHKLVNLAAHIAEHGLNPAESILVTKEAGQLVVLDGNRRVAAMKLLLDPELAGDSSLKPSFTQLANGQPRRDKVDCAEVADRDTARPWILVQHSGQQGGVGGSPWGPVEQYRYDPKPGIQVGKAVRFMDMARRYFPNEDDLLDHIVAIEGGRPSTLGRLVADPRFRARMRMTEDARHEYSSGLPTADLLTAVRWILADFATSTTVDVVKTPDDRSTYIANLPLPSEEPAAGSDPPTEGGDRSDRTGPAARGDQSRPGPGPDPAPADDDQQPRLPLPSPEGGAAPTRRRGAAREPRPTKPLARLTLNNMTPRTRNVLSELRRSTDEGEFVDQYPNAAAILLRTILDICVNEVFKTIEKKKVTEDKKLRTKVKRCLEELDPKKENPAFDPVRLGLDDDTSLHGVNNLHAYVHSNHYDATGAGVRAVANGWEPFLQALNDHLAHL